MYLKKTNRLKDNTPTFSVHILTTTVHNYFGASYNFSSTGSLSRHSNMYISLSAHLAVSKYASCLKDRYYISGLRFFDGFQEKV